MCEVSVLSRRHTNTFGTLVINHSESTSHQKPARSFHSNQRSRKCFQLKWNISASFYNNKTYMGCKLITNDKLAGRTGNQMFQIASVIGLAYKYDLIPLLRNVKPVSDIFDLPNKATITLTKTALMDFSLNCCKYDSKVEHIRPDKNWSIAGFLQTYKYFNPIRDIVSGVFKFHENIVKSPDGYIKKVTIYRPKQKILDIPQQTLTKYETRLASFLCLQLKRSLYFLVMTYCGAKRISDSQTLKYILVPLKMLVKTWR